MKVGILGTGVVGQSLGKGFVALGHTVMVGSRDAAGKSASDAVASIGDGASAGTFAEAAAFGDLLALATLWSGTENALRMAGAEHTAGKVVIDATNPLAYSEHAPPGLALGFSDSGGEQVQRWLPGAQVVKAFNIVGNTQFFKPAYMDGPPDMFICGNDAQAKATVTDILRDFGWPAIDIGDIEGARLLEPLAILWVRCGVRSGAWGHAFKLLLG